jgi:hypothetical protein
VLASDKKRVKCTLGGFNFKQRMKPEMMFLAKKIDLLQNGLKMLRAQLHLHLEKVVSWRNDMVIKT